MSRRLIYIVGPSGVGKDSLLGWLGARTEGGTAVHVARRTLTRPAEAGGEPHEPLAVEAFRQQARDGAFALHWQAHDLHYGVRHGQLAPMRRRRCVLLNGSRGYLPQALSVFPDMTVVHITARPETVRRRLLERGREAPEQIDARLRRTQVLAPPPRACTVDNDGPLHAAGLELLRIVAALDGAREA